MIGRGMDEAWAEREWAKRWNDQSDTFENDFCPDTGLPRCQTHGKTASQHYNDRSTNDSVELGTSVQHDLTREKVSDLLTGPCKHICINRSASSAYLCLLFGFIGTCLCCLDMVGC